MLKIRKGTTVQVQVEILSDDDQPVPLVDVAQVVLKLLDPETKEVLHMVDCHVVDEAHGIVEFDPGVIREGVYERKFEITFVDGSVLVIPNAKQEYVMIW